MSLKIKVKNKEVSTIKDWEKAFNDSKHWKEGRSAYSLADFILNRNGLNEIAYILKDCGLDSVQFLSCNVEASVKFDEYPRNSQRDMVLIGESEDKAKVFITVEAKVDEDFGKVIGKSISNQKSDRAKDLLNKFIPHYTCKDKELQYQLFHAAAATIEKGGYGQDFQKSIILVLVFKTKGYGEGVDYNVEKGNKNHKEFCNFMQAIGANRKGENEVWTLNFKDKEITFIYSQIEYPKEYIKK